MSLWVVGRNKAETESGIVWEFQGVYSTEEMAKAGCHDRTYFLAPAILDESLPHESKDWPGAYYPAERNAT